MKKIRCAIYTRKSSEEGLEQGFNSLDAQREACAAYVMSQASEGWNLLPGVYDDGGISGGTLERPALQRLLADISAGKIDIVVVYKVDRLTRSLLDFAKLVEAFDKAEVSFVSVTQSFNTTTSMGRLTLNMLLSFAQFEREITAERIRDKLAASKAKGMWMGGTPPIGYRNHERTLAIVEEHAKLIRDIFALYGKLGNVRLVAEQLQADGIRSPVRTYGTGRSSGGAILTRGQIYGILNNPVYIGKIRHGTKIYEGLHPAIIDADTWERTQLRLADNTQGESRVRVARPSMLTGLVTDEAGEPLQASHACKGKVRYRYYVSRNLQEGAQGSNHGVRIPARELETAVAERLALALDDPIELASRLGCTLETSELRQMMALAAELAAKVRGKDHAPLRSLVEAVQVMPNELKIELSIQSVSAALGFSQPHTAAGRNTLIAPMRLTRTGMAMRLVQPSGKAANSRDPDQPLTKLLAQAKQWWARLSEGDIDIVTLSRKQGVNDSYMSRVVRLAFLSPEIVETILAGEQPAHIDAAKMLTTQLPGRWDDQAAALAIG